MIESLDRLEEFLAKVDDLHRADASLECTVRILLMMTIF